MNIPYTVERRADTGMNNVGLGVWLFLASEVMLFGALFSAYALMRVAALHWPHGPDELSVALGSANTAALLAGAAAVWATRADAGRRRWLWASTAAGLAFLAIKAFEWRGEIARGLLPSESTFLATYFTLTGVHAAHVIGGLIANLWALAGANSVGDAMTANRLRALTMYWTFIDLVWLVIFVVMYLS